MSSLTGPQKILAIGLVALALGGWAFGLKQRGQIADLEMERSRATAARQSLEQALAKAQEELKLARAELDRRSRVSPGPQLTRRGPSSRDFRTRNDVNVRYHDRSDDLEALVADRANIDELLTSARPRDREKALKALVGSGREDALDLLALSLSDLDEDVREAAIDGLSALGGDEAAAALAFALKDAEAWNREEALDALVKIGGDQAAISLGVALEVNDRSLRIEAVEALGTIGGDEAVKVLGVALRDQDPKVREAAVAALEEIGEERALKLLESVKNLDAETLP